MLGSHPRSNGAPWRVMPTSAVVVALLLGGGIILGGFLTLRNDSPTEGVCKDGIDLSVSAAPQLAEALADIAERYRATSPKVDGRCVTISVTSRATRDTVAQLSNGWAAPPAEPALQRGPARLPRPGAAPPDIWVPESATWLALARTSEDGAKLLPATGTTIATSPVVIAMPRSMAEAVGWPQQTLSWAELAQNNGNPTFWSKRGHAEWGPFRVGLADPASSSASLSAVLNIVSTEHDVPVEKITADTFTRTPVRVSVLTFERGTAQVPASIDSLLIGLHSADSNGNALTHLSAFPSSESEVVAYNRGQSIGAGERGRPAMPLVAFYPPDGLTVEQVPFVLLEHAAHDPSRAQAAENFLQALRGEIGQTRLAAAGFRDPDGKNPALAREGGILGEFPGKVQPAVPAAGLAAAAKTFEGVHRRGVTLAVFDTSGSMGVVVPDSGGRTKMDLAVDAVLTSLHLFANDSQLGLWQFATHLDGDRDYAELLPVGPLDERIAGTSRRDHFAALARDLAPRGDTGLYDTALAAFRSLSTKYVPGRANQVLLITDGVNDDPGSISLDELVTTLEREFDPARPVGIVTIAYGSDADPAALRRISAATGRKSYQSLDPSNILQVLTDALLGQEVGSADPGTRGNPRGSAGPRD